MDKLSYRRHRFPSIVIQQAVWLYFRFALSYRDVEDQPLRQRERRMKRFKLPGSAQRFLSIHAAVYNVFNIQRHLNSRRTLRVFRDQAMLTWRQATVAA
jgi:transposase-like protein